MNRHYSNQTSKRKLIWWRNQWSKLFILCQNIQLHTTVIGWAETLKWKVIFKLYFKSDGKNICFINLTIFWKVSNILIKIDKVPKIPTSKKAVDLNYDLYSFIKYNGNNSSFKVTFRIILKRRPSLKDLQKCVQALKHVHCIYLYVINLL